MTPPESFIYVFTGNGKGKTSAALGAVVRALGWDWRVAVLQFMKSDRDTGERLFFRNFFPQVLFEDLGLGRSCKPGEHKAAAQAGWLRAAELLQKFDGELLVLDELNVTLGKGYLELPAVLQALRERRKGLNVVVTGRYAPPEMLELADLVSSIEEVKHPFRSGIPAQKGLDW